MKSESAPQTLEEALAATGLTYRPPLILFGSRACGRWEPTSDWDLLVIDPSLGPKETETDRYDGVDVVRIPSVLDERFLRTELGAHVAWYGVPISTELPPRDRVNYQQAAEFIEKRFRQRASRWFKYENLLGPFYMEARALRLFLDALRARHLRAGRGVPPTSMVLAEFHRLSVDQRIDLVRPEGEGGGMLEDREKYHRLLRAACRVA